MHLPAAIAGLIIGLVAVLAAMRVRRGLAAQLGREWRMRFLAVQGILINISLYAVLIYIAGNLGWNEGYGPWFVAVAYGPLFFVYSLSNIDWTARKFHGVGN